VTNETGPNNWGQPGYPQPGPPYPPRPRQQRTGLTVAVILLSVALVAAIAVIVVVLAKDDSSEQAGGSDGGDSGDSAGAGAAPKGGSDADAVVDLQIGDCVSITTSGSRDFATTDCNDPKSNLFVLNMAGSNGSCPDDAHFIYAGVKTTSGEVQMCFNVNWIIGQCYRDDGELIAAAPCGPDAPIQPMEKMNGTVYTAECPDGQQAWSWRETVTVMCVTEF